jgi:MFS transporter, UMF1 family
MSGSAQASAADAHAGISPSDQAHNRSRRGVLAWAAYDLANTIFSFNVLSYLVPLVTLVAYESGARSEGEANLALGVAVGLSMLLNALVSPILGAVSDDARARKPFLLAFTAVAVALTLVLGILGTEAGLVVGGVFVWWGLAVFAIANFAYQAALIYYDALLPDVSTAPTRGRVSGLGVGLGYVGTILGALAVRFLTFRNGEPTGASFLLTAALFGIFALPVFLLVRERPGGNGRAVSALRHAGLRRPWALVAATLRDASSHPGLLRFLVARFLYTDPINTVISFMAIFATAAVGLSSADAQTVLIIVTVAAIVMSFVWGAIVDRIGPKRTLMLVLTTWVGALVLAAASLEPAVFILVGIIAGAALGGTWVSDRVFLVRLVPEARIGEAFGLYGLAGKFSAVTGPVIWGMTLFLLEPAIGRDAYRFAILAQLVLMIAGILVLRGVTDLPASSSTDATAPVAAEPATA